LPRGRDLVETTQPRLDFAFLERLPSKRIAIGVLDLEMEKVEKPEVVAARARKALNHVDRTASPRAGLRDEVPGREAACAKLKALVPAPGSPPCEAMD
jgi:5-methyltetrahydropteroyltriglutamate--homocysteine methyltransferase